MAKKVVLQEAKDIAEMLNKALQTTAFQTDPEILLSHIKRWLPWGVTLVDAMTGGIPLGRVVELYGPPDVGKSTLAQWLAKTSLHNGTLVFYIDKEHALDKKRAAAIGLDLTKIIHMEPKTVEQTFEYVVKTLENLVKKGIARDCIFIWDTLARTKTDEQAKGKRKLGSMARAVRGGIVAELGDALPMCNASMLILNHRVAKNIGSGQSSYGSVGGSALYHEASLRLRMGYSGEKRISENDQNVGHIAKLFVEESNVCAPNRDAYLHVRYLEGIDDFASNVFFMKNSHGFTLNGTWYSWMHEKTEIKFQNEQMLKDKLDKESLHEAFTDSVKNRYKELYG